MDSRKGCRTSRRTRRSFVTTAALSTCPHDLDRALEYHQVFGGAYISHNVIVKVTLEHQGRDRRRWIAWFVQRLLDAFSLDCVGKTLQRARESLIASSMVQGTRQASLEIPKPDLCAFLASRSSKLLYPKCQSANERDAAFC